MRTSIRLRPVSWSLSAKCLTVEMTWLLWMPAICAPASIPDSRGSSPGYSKVRPLRGSRIKLTAPPSITLNPRARASAPIMAPPSRTRSRSQVAPMAIPDGNAVAPGLSTPSKYPTPKPASVSNSAGILRRAKPGTKPAATRAPGGINTPAEGMACSPLINVICSARVIFATVAKACASGSSDANAAVLKPRPRINKLPLRIQTLRRVA